MTRSNKGVWCILFPFAAIFVALFLYAGLSFITGLIGSTSSVSLTFIMVIRLILHLLGLIGVLGIFVSVPIGVYLLITSDKKTS